MLHLLKLEFKKYRKNRLIQILAIAYIIFLPALLFIGKKFNVQNIPAIPSNDIFFEFPTLWTYLGYIGNWLTFFLLGFFGLYIVTHEYANKTFRQNIITGMTRNSFYLSKIQLITVVSLLSTLYFLLCGFVIGFAETESGTYTSYFRDDNTGLRYFLMCMGYTTIGFFIGLLVKRSGIALIIYFSYAMVLETVIRWLVHIRVIENKSMHFYPMNAIEDLMPVPFHEMASSFIEEYQFSFFLTYTEAMVTTSVYCVLFIFLGWRYLLRTDL
jgi:hypothetical protein